jgi:hypothetical protein
MTMQDRNYKEIGYSGAKVFEAKEKSPARKYNGSSY